MGKEREGELNGPFSLPLRSWSLRGSKGNTRQYQEILALYIAVIRVFSFTSFVGGLCSPPNPADWPIEVDRWFGCWRWCGRIDSRGYPRTDSGLAHREIWEEAHGRALETQEQLDHLCRRRDCVRLEHLEVVTQSENLKRRSGKYRAKQKQCGKGHDLWANGRRTPEGGVVCRLCSVTGP